MFSYDNEIVECIKK